MDGVVPSRVAVALAWSAFHPGAPELDGTLAAVRVLERFPAATRDVIDAIAADPAGGVIVNRHARFALAGHDRAVHVLLDAPLRWRQEALQAEHGWSATAAHDHLRAADRAQRRYAARAHDVDPTEPSHYDVVVDPSSLGVHGAVAEVLAAATRLGLTPAYDRPR
jgi:cytidylate kinase